MCILQHAGNGTSTRIHINKPYHAHMYLSVLSRNTGFGFLSTLARLGAVVGPQFVYLVSTTRVLE